MPLRNHPTGAHRIHADSLADLATQAGLGAALTLAARFAPIADPHGPAYALDLPGVGVVSLHQRTNQVSFRRPGGPLRHLPLPMQQALLWAAAWCLLDPALEPAARARLTP